MSHDLPPIPNLEHLRKQAKALLRELQQRTPRTKLSEAQHLIARQYGFASWAKLKAHVASLPPPPMPAVARELVRSASEGRLADREAQPSARMFERFTEAARRALFFSRYEAAQLGSPQIEPEHLLLGLARDDRSLPSRIFSRVHLSLERIRDQVRDGTGQRTELLTSVHIPFSIDAKQVLLASVEEADGLHHSAVDTAHLLLGLLQRTSIARSILLEHEIRLEAVRDEARLSYGGPA